MLGSFSWDEYFMTMAYLVSMKSKDPSTRVGAVIVGPQKEVRSTGYNGLPRHILDRPYRYMDKKYKYYAVNHAEENAILHCARNGISAEGCVLYSPWIPCAQCAKSIIQSGISEIIYDKNFPGNTESHDENWRDSIIIAKELLNEADVKMREYDGNLIHLKGLYKGQTFSLYSLVDDE